ncbi:UxaA family hydrolase [Brotaphodocola sp.]|uniref:UxaA family hydrolase n=1 Tax=Brotaphodocola sp. TaxID=3073577 RepID=UPI003D7C3FAD
MQDFIRINENDNVAVALRPIAKGEQLTVGQYQVTTQEEIPQGHKFALKPIEKGSEVIKYGFRIGYTKEAVPAGGWVHVHNLKTALGDLLEYQYHPVASNLKESEHAYFDGYRRTDGKVGVRNEIWIIPTVGCVNSIAQALERQAKKLVGGNVEDVIAFTHPYGCSQMGDDQEHTRTVLADMIHHPNAAGVLVLGLGCENSNIPLLKEQYIGEYDDQRVKFLQCQDVEDEQEEAMKLLEELAVYANGFSREKIDASELIIGMKCGGSDGLSGITANPTVGAFSDLLISKGGTTILTEVPEMFGAETLLMDRCATPELFDKTVHLINDFKNYFKSHNQTIYENPSPGNKKGGISTLEDKSLGCTQKSGSAPVKGVLAYGEQVKEKGLNLLSAPGNDLVASTALAVSGAQIVLFTTGRGTPFASPVPTVKISSNSKLAGHKENWIDFNAGRMVEDKSKEELAQDLFDYVLAVASGKKVKAEEAGFHDMAIFKQGVTL